MSFLSGQTLRCSGGCFERKDPSVSSHGMYPVSLIIVSVFGRSSTDMFYCIAQLWNILHIYAINGSAFVQSVFQL